MQSATISIGSPEGVNKWVVQILFQKPTDSDYNDQGSTTAHTKTSCCTVILSGGKLKLKLKKKYKVGCQITAPRDLPVVISLQIRGDEFCEEACEALLVRMTVLKIHFP